MTEGHLATRMKRYEAAYNQVLTPRSHWKNGTFITREHYALSEKLSYTEIQELI